MVKSSGHGKSNVHIINFLMNREDVIDMRKGDYIGTYTGIHFYPLDPRLDEVRIVDIAHALSNICRFNGHTKYFYSVATHSINVCALLRARGENSLVQLYGLLHDASEAYCCDIPRPLKNFLPEYKDIEAGIMATVYEHFGLEPPDKKTIDAVKEADDFILTLESRRLMNNTSEWNLVEAEGELYLLTSTKEEFLNEFEKINTQVMLKTYYL